ncbi:ESCRT-II subunit protein snf8, partial [Nowakowskiella sp. JEL0078]
MCATIGVDPLASNKGFWSEVMGFGDFYYELGVQIAQVCISTREQNGGLIELMELKRKIELMRGKNAQEISEYDIIRSIGSMKPLGNGFDVLVVGDRKIVQSVPRELNLDFSTVLVLVKDTGSVIEDDLIQKLGWEKSRASRVLDNLVKEGIFWIDTQSET